MNNRRDQRTSHRSIIVAGRNGRNILAVSLLLQRFRYEVFNTTTSAQTLDRVSRKRPDLVIIDQTLPEVSGVDLIQNIRKITGAQSVPVVFMVFPGDAGAESRCLGYGAAGCISKPVRPDELYVTVQQVLEARPRRSIRIDTRIPVSVDDRTLDSSGDGPSIDLSERGMYVPTRIPYSANKRVSLRLFMKERTISAAGAVIYNRTGSDGLLVVPGMGLRFTTIALQDRELIRKFIGEEISRDLNAALLRAATATL